MEIINNELDDNNSSETRKKKIENSILNCIEESKLSKTRHIRVQPIPGGKIDDIKEDLSDLLHEEL